MLHLYQDNPVGGADYLNSLTDVNISNPEDGQMMVYDASTQTWRNVTQKSLNDLAEVTDLTDIIATGTTNATGGTITKGKFFYLNDELCQAKADIASGATFTLNTNYEEVTAGGLNALNSKLSWQKVGEFTTNGNLTISNISNCTEIMFIYVLSKPRVTLITIPLDVFKVTGILTDYMLYTTRCNFTAEYVNDTTIAISSITSLANGSVQIYAR